MRQNSPCPYVPTCKLKMAFNRVLRPLHGVYRHAYKHAIRPRTRARSAGLDRTYSTSQKPSPRCKYGAPYVAVLNEGNGKIVQSCCNHWDCPSCGIGMAQQAQERMLAGAAKLMASGPLYFWTMTCRGKDLDVTTMDDDYYGWTNHALTLLRYYARKDSARWHYVQVTERQQRGAAHSHFIHTFLPNDAVPTMDGKTRTHYRSEIFLRACVLAGLGNQYDITLIDSPMAVALYISGYLTKHAHKDTFPKKWKRIRYSREWPKQQPFAPEWSLPLYSDIQWRALDKVPVIFVAADPLTFEYARHRTHNVTQ